MGKTNKVKTIRKRLKLSQPAMAKELGVSVSALRSWEQNRSAAGQPVMLALQFLEHKKREVAK